jgi:hypothetical protein
MTQGTRPADAALDFPWPLTFDEFSFGSRAFNTLRCNVIFEKHQFALSNELDRPSGPPADPDWKEDWMASFNVFSEMLPVGPVEVRWTSMDGVEHFDEIDLIKDVCPGQVVLHNVPREEVNGDWARYDDKPHPEILMEVNDRTINIYMKARVLTKLPPNPDRPDIVGRYDLVQAWSKTY